MPLYDYKCNLCLTKETAFRKISEPESLPFCVCCGAEMQRVFNAFGLDYQEKGIFPYVDYNLGHEPVVVESRAQWKREMKNRGLSPWSPSSETMARYRDKTRRFY